MKNIQAINVPFQLSADNGLTWLTLVCVSEHTQPLTADTTDTNTQCGVAVGLGPVKFNPTFNAVANIDNTVGQVSLQQAKIWAINQTYLKYRVQDPQTSTSAGGSVGSNDYLSGFGYLNGITTTYTVGDVVKFSGTFKGVGIPSYTPGT